MSTHESESKRKRAGGGWVTGSARDNQSRIVTGPLPSWKLEDAKARFSEVVRRARSQGPQRVTCRGVDAVVVVSADDFERLQASRRPKSLVRFLRDSGLGDVDVAREPDRGRDIRL